jgi:murein DD-endopeptidase
MSLIKWNNLMENERRQFEKMNEYDKFVYFLLLQYGSPYGWGKENPVEADCSGKVCMALFAATGLLIRTTADDLFKRVFTKVNPQQGDIRAVFYVTKKQEKHGDRMVAAGTATHIAGFVDDGVILSLLQGYGVSMMFRTGISETVMRCISGGLIVRCLNVLQGKEKRFGD